MSRHREAGEATHDLLVRQAGYSYDQLEDWVRSAVSAALQSAPQQL